MPNKFSSLTNFSGVCQAARAYMPLRASFNKDDISLLQRIDVHIIFARDSHHGYNYKQEPSHYSSSTFLGLFLRLFAMLIKVIRKEVQVDISRR